MFLLTEHLCASLSIPTYELEPLTQFLKKKRHNGKKFSDNWQQEKFYSPCPLPRHRAIEVLFHKI